MATVYKNTLVDAKVPTSDSRSYGTTIITSPNPKEIEHDNIPLEQGPYYWPETASSDLSYLGNPYQT